MNKAEYTVIYANGTRKELPADDRLTGNADVERNPGMTRHYAFLFNMYVMLQIFNEINAKKLLPNEINVFAGFFNNWFFIIVLLISIGFQVAFVQIKGVAAIMKMKPLNLVEFFITVGIGMSCIIWGKFLLFLNPLLYRLLYQAASTKMVQ
jgi:magnesium-transporting ATPase (P-type)